MCWPLQQRHDQLTGKHHCQHLSPARHCCHCCPALPGCCWEEPPGTCPNRQGVRHGRRLPYVFRCSDNTPGYSSTCILFCSLKVPNPWKLTSADQVFCSCTLISLDNRQNRQNRKWAKTGSKYIYISLHPVAAVSMGGAVAVRAIRPNFRAGC